MEKKIGDLVEINTFDDGNKKYHNEDNLWIITEFKFKRGKSIIKHKTNKNIKPFSISSWKLNKLIYQKVWTNQPS
tara:strand:+ start:1343 stop:1567 length:225 start_codon:yes stop_codon:yes gene_type:complete